MTSCTRYRSVIIKTQKYKRNRKRAKHHVRSFNDFENLLLFLSWNLYLSTARRIMQVGLYRYLHSPVRQHMQQSQDNIKQKTTLTGNVQWHTQLPTSENQTADLESFICIWRCQTWPHTRGLGLSNLQPQPLGLFSDAKHLSLLTSSVKVTSSVKI